MRKSTLVGKKWGDLTNKQRNKLLKTIDVVNPVDSCVPKKSMWGIADFECGVSVACYYSIGDGESETIIEDDAVLYDPS